RRASRLLKVEGSSPSRPIPPSQPGSQLGGGLQDWFRVTAARTRVFNASSSISSPSWKSMARLVFPSRLELKRPEGSFRAAPLAEVIFTTLLYVSPVHTIPSWYHVGTPLPFHSPVVSGSGSFTKVPSRLSVLPPPFPHSLVS